MSDKRKIDDEKLAELAGGAQPLQNVTEDDADVADVSPDLSGATNLLDTPGDLSNDMIITRRDRG